MMKNLKSKLFATVAMLLVAIVMMSSASYAWFTISTNPEIKDLTATIVVNENLEIAYRKTDSAPGVPAIADTTKSLTYGNLLDTTTMTDAYKTDYLALDKTLRPAALSGTAFKTVSYGDDGRVNELDVDLDEAGTAGMGNLVDSTGKIYGYYIRLWVRSNVGGSLTLCEAAKRSANGETGDGSTFTATSGDDDAQKDLAKGIRLATKLGDGNITALTTTNTGGTSSTFSGNNIGTLEANEDTELTIYVFLDGDSVTNASASIDGIATGTVAGELNLQFAIAGVTRSMDGEN